MIINSRIPELLDCVKQEFDSIQSESQSLKAQTQEFESHISTCTTDLTHLRDQLFHLDREHQKLKTQYEEELRRLHLELEQRSSTTGQPSTSNQLSSHDPRAPPNLSSSANPTGPGGSINNSFGSIVNSSHPPPNAPNFNSNPSIHHDGGSTTANSNNLSSNRGEYDTYPNGGSRNTSNNDNPSNLSEHPSKRLRTERDRTIVDTDLDPRGTGPGGSSSVGLSMSHNPNVAMASSPVLPHPSGRAGPESSKNKMKPNDSQYSKLPNHNASHSYGGNPYHSRAEVHIPPLPSHHHPGPGALSSGGGGAQTVMSGGSNQSSATPLQQPPSSNNNNNNHSNVLLDIDPETLPSNMKKEGPDWMTMFNPNVKKVLDVGLVHTLVHDSVVCCVKFSPDGTILATGCNRYTSLYNTRTGSKICQLLDETHGNKGDNYIRSASFSPDGQYLATGSEDRIIRIWDITQKRIMNRFQGHKSEIYSLAFSPDGRILVSGSGDKTARIWDMGTGSCLFHLVIEDTVVGGGSNGGDTSTADAGVTSVCVSPDGTLLAAGSLDTVVRLWNTSNGQLLDKLKGHKDSVYSVAFSPDGKFLVSGSLDKTLKLWDLSTLNREPNPSFNSIIKKEDPGSNSSSASNNLSNNPNSTTTNNNNNSNGNNSTSASNNLSERGENGEKIISDRGFDPNRSSTVCTTTLIGHKDYVLSVAVSPDGEWIMSGSKDRGVQFWDPKTAKPQFMLQGHKNSVISIAVSDSGGLLATGSGDWHARIWSYERVVPNKK